MKRPITAGVDGTEESLAALAWAAREAVRRDLALRVVHAWRYEPHEVVEAADPEVQAGWAKEAVGEAARTVTERHPGLEVSTDVVAGADVDALVAAAAEAEMLVLGSRGHGRVVGFLVGSVGQQVIVEAARPVVLVRAGDAPSGEAVGREIVVGQQGDPQDSAEVLRFAFEAAAARGATVRAVRAWTLPPVFAYSPGSLKLLDEAGGLEPYEKKALSTALQPVRDRFPDVPVVEHVEMGSAGQVLLSVAGDAQLVVVGRRAHRTAVGARIGSVAHGVLHHAGCPVAVVPHV
ncbi:universal stress protein [Streptomyces sp. AC555_RSS877]|uniref:universal stress protein n=1 Tax=Streptomyces sp. AC555_RSS877 TaxID=2823688 RepID=UPI001C2755F5|nr:universal stress protein [Streptomyces sp. AC555_RSS877]